MNCGNIECSFMTQKSLKMSSLILGHRKVKLAQLNIYESERCNRKSLKIDNLQIRRMKVKLFKMRLTSRNTYAGIYNALK